MIGDFTLGDSLRFQATFRTASGVLFDPGSTWGKVFDSTSTVVASPSTLTRVDTGYYTYEWQSDPASHARGPGAFEAFGFNAGQTYRRREILFKLV
jgi:hypothetical protein